MTTGLAIDLGGLGIPVEQAERLGWSELTTKVGTGTAQTGAVPITSSSTRLTTASGQTAAVLSATAPLNRGYLVNVTTSTTGLVFPPSGGNINGGTLNASVNVAQGQTRFFMRLNQTDWLSWITS